MNYIVLPRAALRWRQIIVGTNISTDCRIPRKKPLILAEEIQLFSSSSWSTPLDSVFQSGWISLDGRWHNIALKQDWTVLRHLRSQYYQLVEKVRQAKGIKTSAQIDLTLELEDNAMFPLGQLLQKYASQLPELFLCASVNVAAQSTLTARNDTVLTSETISLPSKYEVCSMNVP
ncbi:hypothetical protein BDF22DRAFT_740624 [Syncephalis plumigaleata]|nr:hypothetical protein BDF22DRAFT_740624 [Syncephalis plumigaleata]